MASAIKNALEDLLRSRRLQADEPLLRGEDPHGRALSTGIAGLDDLLLGGFPRGQISEVHGACSSGRTALVLALAARLTRAGSLVAWVDPGDRLDPGSASAAGVHLARLLWLRGERRGRETLLPAVSAVGTLLGSGLFEAVVFDLACIADGHVSHGPTGAALAMKAAARRWSGAPPARLLRGVGAEVREARRGLRGATVELQACS